MKPMATSNNSSTSCLIEEEVLEYVKYSKSDALLITQKTDSEDCAYACREKDESIIIILQKASQKLWAGEKPICFQGEKQSPAYSIGGRSKYRRRKHKIYVPDVDYMVENNSK